MPDPEDYGLIRNFDRVDEGVEPYQGDQVGIIRFEMQIHVSALPFLGIAFAEVREWNDVTMTVYQDVREYECPDCSVEFSLKPFGVREDRCEDHEFKEIRIEGLEE